MAIPELPDPDVAHAMYERLWPLDWTACGARDLVDAKNILEGVVALIALDPDRWADAVALARGRHG